MPLSHLLGTDGQQGDVGVAIGDLAAALIAAGPIADAINQVPQFVSIVGPDADWTIPPASHVVVPLLTASRTWSLPDVDGFPKGVDLVIVDEGRFLGFGPVLTIGVLAGSGDTIPGYPSGIYLADAGASVRLRRGLLSDVWVVV